MKAAFAMNTSLSPERWDQVQRLFNAVVDLGSEQRAARLDDACRDDPALRDEVDSLLAAYARADDLLQDLDQMGEAPPFAPPTFASRTGSTVSHYEVREKLGGGGMGVVYKAFDTRLKRIVALKFLPSRLSIDEHARQRFEHEAQAASALDHANICTIYEIGESADGHAFIAMACYEGETLKEKIADGLTVEQALDYAGQMARGLARAHEAGIVHRDIKPANVIVTRRGVVKIVDFGLAKVADVQLTQTGTTMGTVSYMSPEQARGERVDHQTDLWSLGVVLYEMLTGEVPFKGDYGPAIIYTILNQAPTPMTELRSDLPPALAQVVAQCLQKGKERRYQTASALLADLEACQQRLTPSVDRAVAERAQARARRNGLLAGVGVLAALALLLLAPSVRQAVSEGLGLTGLPKEKHLVVLPAASTAAVDPDVAFTEGLVETLVSGLRQLEGTDALLSVTPSGKVKEYGVDTPAKARSAFGANLALLVGTERNAENVRVTVDLVEAEHGRSLRATEVTQPTADLSALKGELILALAGLLDADLTPSGHRAVTAGGTAAPGAYEFYTTALGYLQHYAEGKNLDAAINLFEMALREDSSYALAYAGLGEAYWRRYEIRQDLQWAEKAESYCEKAIELDDQLAPVYVTLGLIRTGRGRYGSALGDFQNALARDSANVEAYLGLAATYEALGRFDEAEAAYQRAIAVKPGYWDAHSHLGIFYYGQARYEEAISPFEHMIALAPLNTMGYSNLGAMYWFLERRKEAIDMFQRALAIEPSFVTYSNLATLFFYEGQYEEAAQTYEKALAIEDSDFRVWDFMAALYHWTGQREKARTAFERAITMLDAQWKLNPRDLEVLAHLANNHAYLGQPEQALAYLDQLIAQEPAEGQITFTIADTYEQLGRREQALTWIEKTLELGYALVEINAYPGLEALRADARFQTLLQRHRGDEP